MIIEDYRYRFTEEEKARIVRRREESTTIRQFIRLWYQTITSFDPYIHRSTDKDNGFKGRTKDRDITIIKYNLLSCSNGMIMDLARSDISHQQEILDALDGLFRSCGIEKFRIKFTIYHNPYSNSVEWANLQVLFVEKKDTRVEPQGKHITILHVEDPDIKHSCELLF